MECRPGCAACCIAPSISTAIPGMPQGKVAGVACVQLDEQGLCRLFASVERPSVCSAFSAGELCGASREQALVNITELERLTA